MRSRGRLPDEDELETLAADLERVRAVAIDASSIIYLEKCGSLVLLSRTVELLTVPQVVHEVGDDTIPVIVSDLGAGMADDRIFNLAFSRHMPLVSEDRKLLLRAERNGIDCYNSLMMLCLLMLHGAIGSDDFRGILQKLYSISRYNERVRAFGESLASFIMQKR